MAQIVSFPQAAVPQNRRLAMIGQAARHSVSGTSFKAEAVAQFERMVAHHADMQRRLEDFNQRCEQALAARAPGVVVDFQGRRASILA
jgi:hypothetical protein